MVQCAGNKADPLVSTKHLFSSKGDLLGSTRPLFSSKGYLFSSKGVLFSSNIFPSHAPEGTAIMRVILGGTRDPQAIQATDEELLMRAIQGLESLLGKLPTPCATRIHRYPSAIPQYTMGHLDRVRSVRTLEAQENGLFFTGNHLDGVAVKDCIRNAEETASRVKLELSR